MAAHDQEKAYSVAQLADLWGCSRDLIYDLIASGRLESFNLGSGRAKTRVTATAAAAYRQKQARTARRSAA